MLLRNGMRNPNKAGYLDGLSGEMHDVSKYPIGNQADYKQGFITGLRERKSYRGRLGLSLTD